MPGVPKVRAVWAGIAVTVLALSVGYFSAEGLITGHTRAIAKNAYAPLSGIPSTVTAIAYGVFALALGSFAVMCFSSESGRRDVLFKWGRNISITAAVILFSGALFK